MAPSAVGMVLVEGENGDGALVDQEVFDVAADPAVANTDAAEQVISAILGTREGAAEGGYQLAATGVTWRDQEQAEALRDALANRKIENVMLVSAFLAAAALAHSVGNETNYAQTALLFIEPDTATLAVVDSADGSITDIHRQPLPDDDDAAVAQLAELAAGAEALETRPDALFVVGSGVDIPLIKPTLEAATTLPVTAAEEPETALARGAALASANFPLLSSSTTAQAYAQAPSTGTLEAYALEPALFDDVDDGLAYSALDSEHDLGEQEDSKPFALLGSILASIFVIGVASLVVSLAVSMRSTSSTRPEPGQAIVAPHSQAPEAPAPQAPAPQAPAPQQVPSPAPEQAPAPQVPEQAPAPQAPVNVPQAPAPVPEAPAPVEIPAPAAPAPAAPVPVPVPVLPPIFTPQLPISPQGPGGRGGGPPGFGKGPGGGGGGHGGGHGGGGRGGFNIPFVPGI
ncbi:MULTISPECIES: hypothetical protein [Mycobacterium]|nr:MULTISPECIES: hypothetical protein [Mycobacterium]